MFKDRISGRLLPDKSFKAYNIKIQHIGLLNSGFCILNFPLWQLKLYRFSDLIKDCETNSEPQSIFNSPELYIFRLRFEEKTMIWVYHPWLFVNLCKSLTSNHLIENIRLVDAVSSCSPHQLSLHVKMSSCEPEPELPLTLTNCHHNDPQNTFHNGPYYTPNV